MVAPKRWVRKRRRRKWRQHCSTCGVQIKPSTWAYCSKICERDRVGEPDGDSMTEDAVERFLVLSRELEQNIPSDQANRIRAELAVMQQEKEQPVAKVVRVTEDGLQQHQAEFWVAPVRREADKFELTMRKSLAAAIRLGDLLVEAKEQLAHGEFGRLFSDHAAPVDGAMPFSASWARRLMAIAESPVLSKRDHGPVLPADLNAVYQLSRLDDDQLDAAIKAGDIHPRMGRDEVRALLPSNDSEEPTEEVMVGKLLEPLRMKLATIAADRPDLFGEVHSRIKAMLRAIKRTLDEDATGQAAVSKAGKGK